MRAEDELQGPSRVFHDVWVTFLVLGLFAIVRVFLDVVRAVKDVVGAVKAVATLALRVGEDENIVLDDRPMLLCVRIEISCVGEDAEDMLAHNLFLLLVGL